MKRTLLSLCVLCLVPFHSPAEGAAQAERAEGTDSVYGYDVAAPADGAALETGHGDAAAFDSGEAAEAGQASSDTDENLGAGIHELCRPALEIGDVEGLQIATTRSSMDGGWFFYFGLAHAIYENPLGAVNDNGNIFEDGAGYEQPQATGVWVGRDSEDIAVQAGDYVTVTYDGGRTRKIYFPALSGESTLYIGFDGSTYWDRDLCDLAQAAPRAPWPMFQHDAQHTGRSEYAGPYRPTLAWSYRFLDSVYSSPAIGTDGRVYVGSDDLRFYSFTPNGDIAWSYRTDHEITSSPAIGFDGSIYITSQDNTFYSIRSNGGLDWSYRMYNIYYSTPAIGSDGTVYVGDGNMLYSMTPNGGMVWSYRKYSSIDSYPAVDSDGRVYVN
ncbi:MAG TPA: PQQ-binding-like beta-propeller repeat protein, partial [bacterium]|nr:PQQ-binding-like beta-propeller repeat protein [bacterium]